MDILDILLDILLKPPQPFIGLFFDFHFRERYMDKVQRRQVGWEEA